MRRLIILSLTLLSCISGYAQDTNTLTIIGQITDKAGDPLKNASVVEVKTKRGRVTNNAGVFYLTLPRQAVTLQVSYIGFHSREREISLEEMQKDTLYLQISLDSKIEELDPVDISSEQVQLAYNKPAISIIDYDFFSDRLCLLIHVNKQYKIRIVDDFDHALSEITLSFRPEAFYRDCFDNLNVLSKDSIYQIYYDEAGFRLLEGGATREFQDFLLPCVASTPENLYFSEYGPHNRSIIYFLIEKSNREKKLVQYIRDEESEDYARLVYRDFLGLSAIAPMATGDNDIDGQKLTRKAEQMKWMYQKLISKPIYHPLFILKDSVFIFNHLNDSAYVFEQGGNFRRSFFIDHHQKQGWKNELIADHSKAQVYAKLNRRGITYLLQINPDNGKTEKEIKIQQHLFPLNIKVKDGYVYYLYRDKNDHVPVMKLYRQRI